jgi:transcriptional regulator with XRE-family HTH domain
MALTLEALLAERPPNLPEPAERRRRRQKLGHTQARVADYLGVPRATFTKYELGLREPHGEVRRRYAELLGALA